MIIITGIGLLPCFFFIGDYITSFEKMYKNTPLILSKNLEKWLHTILDYIIMHTCPK